MSKAEASSMHLSQLDISPSLSYLVTAVTRTFCRISSSVYFQNGTWCERAARKDGVHAWTRVWRWPVTPGGQRPGNVETIEFWPYMVMFSSFDRSHHRTQARQLVQLRPAHDPVYKAGLGPGRRENVAWSLSFIAHCPSFFFVNSFLRSIFLLKFNLENHTCGYVKVYSLAVSE